jgi:hypothetical protein
MFKVLHVEKSKIPACSTKSKPVKQHTSLCKDLREMLRYEQLTGIPALFSKASRCGCTDAEINATVPKLGGDCAVVGECATAKDKLPSSPSTSIGTLAEAMAKCSAAIRKTFHATSGDCIYQTMVTEGVVINGHHVQDIAAAEEADIFDCRSCSKDQKFVGSGEETVDATDCTDGDVEMEILFVLQTDNDPLTENKPEHITCADVADRGLCKFHQKVRKTPSWPRSWATFSVF